MSDADEQSAGYMLWQQAREKYENPAIDLKSIAESLGINRPKLIAEARRRGWKLRGTGRIGRRREPDPKRSGVDWIEVRRNYEGSQYSIREICVRNGIGVTRLYDRRNSENWEARCPAHPKAYGTGHMVNATQRLKALVAGKLAALEGRLGTGEKIDVGDPLKGLHTLASAYEKMLTIEHREKLHDEGERIGRLIIDDASREALARRLDELARTWRLERDSRSPEAGGLPAP